MALDHRRATMVTKVSEDVTEFLPQNLCKCCQHPLIGKQISFCTSAQGLEFLGVGFPLYFQYLKS